MVASVDAPALHLNHSHIYELKEGPAAAKCEDHSSSDCIALTGLPTAWEGDSYATNATRELDEDAAKDGGSQQRSPARRSQILEEDVKSDNEDAAKRGGSQKQLPALSFSLNCETHEADPNGSWARVPMNRVGTPGENQKRSPARSLETLEEDAQNDYQLDAIVCSNCDATHGEKNELYGDYNEVRECKQCKLQQCMNCKWMEACSHCNSQVCGECMRKHLDICSGSRTRRNRDEAIRRKKAKEGEAKEVKVTGGGKATTGTTTDALGHVPQR